MKQHLLARSALIAAFLVLASCSKQSSTDVSASSSAAAPESAGSAAAPSAAAPSAAAPAVQSAAAPAAAPAAPTATLIALDIKDASGAPVRGDPVSGAKVFLQCGTCHVITPGVNKVGPSLHGIIGRHSGSIPTFHYSDANKQSGIVWTEQELYTYLENPQKLVPGTYMTFVGVKDPQKRADVIAYLQENTK